MNDVKEFAGTFQNFAVAAAALIGGLWAWYRYRSERTSETAIGIDISKCCHKLNKRYFLFVEVALTNKGKRKVDAQKDKDESGFAYSDSIEHLKYSCSLQIKRVEVEYTTSQDGEHLDWYESKNLKSVVPEINLMTEYENPDSGKTDFWIEPGETYHLGAAAILSPGDYLLRVTFVGVHRGDYWSRVVSVYLPCPNGGKL